MQWVSIVFLVGHGDTIDPSIWYRIVRKLYQNRYIQSLARMIPPDWLYRVVHRCCLQKQYPINNNSVFVQKDRIFQYCRTRIEPVMHHNFYVFGHTHMPFIQAINDSSYYCNLGDWMSHYTYACFDGIMVSLHKF